MTGGKHVYDSAWHTIVLAPILLNSMPDETRHSIPVFARAAYGTRSNVPALDARLCVWMVRNPGLDRRPALYVFSVAVAWLPHVIFRNVPRAPPTEYLLPAFLGLNIW